MFCWQITKYNPKYRNADRAYLKDEWTEYGDIGKTFEGKKLTYEEYEKVEEAHIKAVLLFMDCLGIDSLKVVHLSKDCNHADSVTVADIKIKNNTYYTREIIIFIIKSILRYEFWCILEAKSMRVRFEYDYYMLLACKVPCTSIIQQIEQLGLFVETKGCDFLFDEEDDDTECCE